MKSMTGYGAAEGPVGKGRLWVEIKSVNHRFCEVGVKLPPKMGAIEGLVRKVMQQRFLRGKIEVFMKEKTPLFGGALLTVDVELAKNYRACYQKLTRALGEKTGNDFLSHVGLERFVMLEEREGSYGRLWSQIARLIKRAADQVDRMRTTEGRHTTKDQRQRLAHLRRLVIRVKRQSALAFDQHLSRMRRRMANGPPGTPPPDERRLEEEAGYLVGRQDIAEELVRLESHLEQYADLLSSHEAVGRKLDFLLQEMNREINTLGAKAADAKISRLVVDGKAELERLREQVQNIE